MDKLFIQLWAFKTIGLKRVEYCKRTVRHKKYIEIYVSSPYTQRTSLHRTLD